MIDLCEASLATGSPIAQGIRAIHVYPSAGINRHAVGNERVLQERSSEPPDLEFCGGGHEAVVEA